MVGSEGLTPLHELMHRGFSLRGMPVVPAMVVPMMAVVGGVFVILWVVALRLGGRIDRERGEWDAAHPGQVSA